MRVTPGTDFKIAFVYRFRLGVLPAQPAGQDIGDGRAESLIILAAYEPMRLFASGGKGGFVMATYFVLFRFTQKGLESIKESPFRVEKAKGAFKELGANVKEFYALLGAYDTVFIAEAPNDETIAKAAMAVAALGNVRTEILRAFTEDEFRKVVAGLP